MKSWVCRHAEGLVLSSYLLLVAILILFDKGPLP
ncbi:hypothetical protein ES707_19345 [subsurface metagenome]